VCSVHDCCEANTAEHDSPGPADLRHSIRTDAFCNIGDLKNSTMPHQDPRRTSLAPQGEMPLLSNSRQMQIPRGKHGEFVLYISA
jgi:hypothetical protein